MRVRITKSGHTCGSTTGELRSMMESGVYESAPDVVSLEILGLDEPTATGFVALESLVGSAMVASSANHAEEAR